MDTIAKNLREMIVNLGEVPRGRTTAELLSQLETLVNGGGIVAAELTDEELDEVFNGS